MFLSLVFGANQNPFKQFLIYNIREPHEFDSFWEKSVSFWYAWTILTIGTYRLKTEATYCTSISSSGTQTRDILCYCSPGSRFFRREQRVRTRRCRCGTRSCVSHLDGEIYFWITLCYAEIKLKRSGRFQVRYRPKCREGLDGFLWYSYFLLLQPAWPVNSCQMSIKVAQKRFH